MSVVIIGTAATILATVFEETNAALIKRNINKRRNRSYQRFDPKRR